METETRYQEEVVSEGVEHKNIEELISLLASKNLMDNRIHYKYFEDRIISDFHDYIDNTYAQHYQTENNVQCFDAWIALGESTPTFRNTAIKYLWRYGKKNSNDKGDLLKALHYTLMCLYVDHYKDGK